MHAHEPPPPEHRETIDLWVSDFLDRPAAREVAAKMGEDAGSVLSAFLGGACHGGKAPADIESSDASHALLDHCSSLALTDAQKGAVPALVAAFLGDLEDQGRLAGGRDMASLVRAAGDAFRRRASGQGEDLTRPSAKIGRNDPCPCGSGKKYKKCCQDR